MIAACNRKKAESTGKWNSNTCLIATVWDTSNINGCLHMLLLPKIRLPYAPLRGKVLLKYIVKYLPAHLNGKGEKICVTVAPLQPEEEFTCSAFGITYPRKQVVNAGERQ